MSRPIKILLATDGSKNAQAVTDFLMGLPLAEQSRVTLFTVIKEAIHEEELAELPQEYREEYEAARERAHGEAQQMLDTEAQRLHSVGLEADTLIRYGHAAQEIVRVASEEQYAIIAIGSHGTRAPNPFHLGSVSDRVFEYAPCSVLIVRPTSDEAVSDQQLRILLAYDDSAPARAAVQLCASLPFPSGTHLKVVTTLPLIHMFRQDIRQQMNWVWKEKKERARQGLERVAGEAGWGNIQVETQLIENEDVAQGLLDQAETDRSDLLVIGHKGKRRLERFLLGSVTARVAHHAPCSVLCVRERD